MDNINTENKTKKVSIKIILFWVIAFIITGFSAYYQRITGPTYPISGTTSFQGKDISYKLDRSCDTSRNSLIRVNTGDPSIKGYLEYKRYKTNDDKRLIEMKNDNGTLTAEFPNEKDRGFRLPAAKIEYRVLVVKDDAKKEIPETPVVLRFKGDVPMFILLFHIIVIFAAMLVSTRAGIEFFNKEPNFKKLALWALVIMTLGGMILGPIVQKYAFGEYWTGIPFGFDLTDNKTLIAWTAWAAATFGVFKSKKPGLWVLGAALVTLIVFAIPHSVLGSELDYSKMK